MELLSRRTEVKHVDPPQGGVESPRSFDPDRLMDPGRRDETPDARGPNARETFDPDRLMDGFATPYAQRRLPDACATFLDEPGESKAVPNTETEAGRKAKEKLDQCGLDGIEYRDRYPDFSPCSETTVEIEYMTSDRPLNNFPKADAACARQWNDEGRDGRSDWTASDVKAYRRENRLTWHECEDVKTCQLVPMDIHSAFAHCGGVCEYKYRHNMTGGFDA